MALRLTIAAIFAALFASSAARAQAPSDVEELMTVDRAFAAYAANHGTPEAFRVFMSTKDSLGFEGGPEPARGAEAIYRAQGGGKPAKGQLKWTPVEAFASRSADMGVTWGRWSFSPNDPAKKPATGVYVTVWRKDPSGAWKGLVDIGNPD